MLNTRMSAIAEKIMVDRERWVDSVKRNPVEPLQSPLQGRCMCVWPTKDFRPRSSRFSSIIFCHTHTPLHARQFAVQNLEKEDRASRFGTQKNL